MLLNTLLRETTATIPIPITISMSNPVLGGLGLTGCCCAEYHTSQDTSDTITCISNRKYLSMWPMSYMPMLKLQSFKSTYSLCLSSRLLVIHLYLCALVLSATTSVIVDVRGVSLRPIGVENRPLKDLHEVVQPFLQAMDRAAVDMLHGGKASADEIPGTRLSLLLPATCTIRIPKSF